MEGLVWIHNNWHGTVLVNQFFKGVTMLGDGAIIWLVLAGILLFFKKTRVPAVVMLVSLVVGFVFNDLLLKNLIERARPYETCGVFSEFIKGLGMELEASKSFPSGHTYSSFNCAVILTLFNKKSGFVLLPLATLIAFSRIFLCFHYPTDVLAGLVLGVVTAVVVFCCYKLIIRKIKAKKREKIRTTL